MSKLKMFWKEAPFLQLQFNDAHISDNVFGIEIDSILNRAKFVFDTTVCQSLLSTFSNYVCASNFANIRHDTYLLFPDELSARSIN